VLRTALKPRWLGLLAIVATVMASFALLGLWQLNVARDKGRAEQVSTAPTRPVADLDAVLIPDGAFPGDGTGRRIFAMGRYDGSGQVLVTPRRLAGRAGYWVVTPFVVRTSGARIAVVRGFVTDPAQAIPPLGTTPITLSGTLAPGESPPAEGASPAPTLPEGQIAVLDLSLLVNRWPGTLYNGFVFATAEHPDLTSSVSPAVQRVPPPPVEGAGLSWLNLGYALQWWVFALFAAYMWCRMVRDDYLDTRDDQEHLRNQGGRAQPAPYSETGKATYV
jgi:surfeit locus 1 family protein